MKIRKKHFIKFGIFILPPYLLYKTLGGYNSSKFGQLLCLKMIKPASNWIRLIGRKALTPYHHGSLASWWGGSVVPGNFASFDIEVAFSQLLL